jgi:hypothetical protein
MVLSVYTLLLPLLQLQKNSQRRSVELLSIEPMIVIEEKNSRSQVLTTSNNIFM